MKKIFIAILLGLMTIGLTTSCSTNSPSGIVKSYMKCLNSKDAKGIVELSYIEGLTKNGEELEKYKAEYLEMLSKEDAFKSLEDKGGIKSTDILNEDVSDNPEPGSIAFVTVKTVFKNGEEVEDKVKVVMDKNGKWKVALY